VTDPEGSFVTNIDGLSAHYAKPTERVLKKRLDHVNAVGRAFIAASPFLVLATGSQRASTVRRRAIGLGSWRLRMTVGRCSFPTVAATI
jgi:hypothetical protein